MFEFPQIIAHRGASFSAYENSYSAFKEAIRQHADMIELDIHLTQDGFFIIHHDPVIKYENQTFNIADTKLEEIENLSLPNGEKVPLLSDVLRSFLADIAFNIEIKCEISENQFNDVLLEAGGDNSKIIVSSFKLKVLEELKEKKLNYKLGFLYTFPNNRDLKMALRYSYIDSFNPYYRFLTKKRIRLFHDLKKEVITWTVDKKANILKLVKNGVNGIITNRPEPTRKIVEGYIKKRDN